MPADIYNKLGEKRGSSKVLFFIFKREPDLQRPSFWYMEKMLEALSIIINRQQEALKIFKIWNLQVNMSYKVTQVLVVTFWYTNSIWNPIIYFASKTQTKETLKSEFTLVTLKQWPWITPGPEFFN